MKRGTIKAFREYLNERYRDDANWKHNRYHQLKRGYGDYLYHQDREMFDVCLKEALAGDEKYDGFKF